MHMDTAHGKRLVRYWEEIKMNVDEHLELFRDMPPQWQKKIERIVKMHIGDKDLSIYFEKLDKTYNEYKNRREELT